MDTHALFSNDDVANRRTQLRRWIRDRFDDKQAAFVDATGINQGELSGLLSKKSFGEKRARSLEAVAGMPDKYLEQRSGTLNTDGTYSTYNSPPQLAQELRSDESHIWPFTTVTRRQVELLNKDQLGLIEDFILVLVARSARKSKTRATESAQETSAITLPSAR